MGSPFLVRQFALRRAALLEPAQEFLPPVRAASVSRPRLATAKFVECPPPEFLSMEIVYTSTGSAPSATARQEFSFNSPMEMRMTASFPPASPASTDRMGFSIQAV